MLMLLHRLVGEGVELVFDPAEYVCPVKLDVGQLTQVLLNLCANARDAMDGHGRLTIATAVVRTQCAQMEGDSEMPPGTYGALIVSDGGGGMTPEVRERIFEPFFTTKGIGKGTGLGLATVYGIVRQSGGFISVRSTVGVGSEFRLYFPQAEQPSSPAVEPAKRELLEEGHETILVVEDEAELRSAVVESLRSLGYKVRHASDGRRALEIAEQMPSVDVLVTDVVMPNMRGTEMAKYLRRMFPAMRIIFMSGYADGMVKPEELNAETVFLAKPLTLAKLARTIRDLVSEAVPSGAH
jgi:CheY-like chemotaxis protein